MWLEIDSSGRCSGAEDVRGAFLREGVFQDRSQRFHLILRPVAVWEGICLMPLKVMEIVTASTVLPAQVLRSSASLSNSKQGRQQQVTPIASAVS